MKKVIFAAVGVVSITLFSFKGASEGVFQREADGNYTIADGSKIEQADWDLMKASTRIYDGSTDLKDYKTKIIFMDWPPTRIYVVDRVPSNPEPGTPAPKEVMDYLLAKYN